MIKLKDFLNAGSLFSNIGALEKSGLVTSKALNMDAMLKINDGEKTIYDKLIPLELVQIADLIHLNYGDKWERIINLNSAGYETGVRNKNTLTETVTDSNNKTMTRNSVNKVTGYNDGLMNDTDSNVSNDVESGDNSKVRTVTNSTGDIYTAYQHLNLQQKNNIITIIMNDVSEFLTLSIY